MKTTLKLLSAFFICWSLGSQAAFAQNEPVVIVEASGQADPQNQVSVDATCPSGYSVIGGGWNVGSDNSALILASEPVNNRQSWRVTMGIQAQSQPFSAFAICGNQQYFPPNDLTYVYSAEKSVYSSFLDKKALVVATCPAGSTVLGGGFWMEQATPYESTPDQNGIAVTGDGWRVRGIYAYNSTTFTVGGTVQSCAVCTDALPSGYWYFEQVDAPGAQNNTLLYDVCADINGQPSAATGGGGYSVNNFNQSAPDPVNGGWLIQTSPNFATGDFLGVVCSPFPVSPSVPGGEPPPTGPSRASVLPIVRDSSPGFLVTFSSTLPGQGQVLYGQGPACPAHPYRATHDEGAGTTSHRITVVDAPGQPHTIEPGATYSFKVVTQTRGGGTETDDNGGACYTVTIPAR
jgi:hypothetical protein